MRTIVDFPAEQITALDAYTKSKGISRAEAVRRAVAAFVPAVKSKRTSLRDHPAVGTLSNEEKDRNYVRKLRAEWDGRP